jgi:4-amino-4-deoxy-L-arabinose transferase-like glycosyltransferase
VVWAGVLFGLALAMKQQAVLFLPLVGLYALLHLDRGRMLRLAGAGTAVLAAVVLPFLLWNPGAFLAGTAGFFYGSGVDAYPIRGLGLEGILQRTGVISNRWAAFPSAEVQLPLLGLVLVLAAHNLRRRWSWPAFWAWLGLEGLVLFGFGRVLAPNYLDLVITLLLLAIASALVGEGPVETVIGAIEGAPGGRGVIGVEAADDARHLPAV